MIMRTTMIAHGVIVIIIEAEMTLHLIHINAEAVALIAPGIDPITIATDQWLLTTE